MKRIFYLIAICLAFVTNVNAQDKGPIRENVQKTITATDTALIKNVASNVISMQYTYIETSGTSAGKIYIEGTDDGVGWVFIDSSLSISDNTNVQTKWLAVTATSFRDYRARCSNPSSATATIYFTLLRRPDEAND